MSGQKRFIEVVDYETDRLVHSINVTGKSDKHVELAMAGMQRNLSDKFFIRDTKDAAITREKNRQ